MTSIKINDFINAYENGFCLHFVFLDWKRAKNANKNQPLVLIGHGGKILPTPNETIRKLCSQFSCDYVLRSLNGGDVQQVIVDSESTAKAFGAGLTFGAVKSPLSPPCSASASCTIETSTHIALAKRLGLV